MQRSLLLPLALVISLSMTISASAQHAIPSPEEEFMRAKVIEILQESNDHSFGMQRTSQKVLMRITSGQEKGRELILENGVLSDRSDMRLSQGETVILRTIEYEGVKKYLISEKYRLPSLLWLGAFFLMITFLFGGVTGIRSIFGLGVSILILSLYVVPAITAGKNPLLVSLFGSFAIACTSLYLAHGFTKRTSVALLSTLSTLSIAVLLSVIFVHVSKLFGMGTEESMYLQSGASAGVNLRGLLLGGMIIGCLGVLDDITTAQTAAVDEIRKANPSLKATQLLRSGLSVGKEHIASLINTLALAYVGASLPLLLLFQTNETYPLWVTLNSEFLAEEIVRTLVGSTTLLLAVPIATWCAVKFLSNDGKPSIGHCHSHSHSHLHGACVRKG